MIRDAAFFNTFGLEWGGGRGKETLTYNRGKRELLSLSLSVCVSLSVCQSVSLSNKTKQNKTKKKRKKGVFFWGGGGVVVVEEGVSIDPLCFDLLPAPVLTVSSTAS